MSRARNIKPSFFVNDDLSEIDPLGRLLFIGLWTIADREGRMEDRPKRIKAEILPYDNCDVDSLLDDLQKYGFVLRYEVDGKRFIQVVNFLKHQNPHMKESESTIPAPCKHSASTVQAPEQHTTNPADSLNLIPESLNLIPESVTACAGVCEAKPNVEIAKAFNANKVRCQASDPRIIALASHGVTPDLVSAACREAMSKKPEEKIPIGYVLKIIESWAKGAKSLNAKGATHNETVSEYFNRKRREVNGTIDITPDPIRLG